jgi:hypothetical protein
MGRDWASTVEEMGCMDAIEEDLVEEGTTEERKDRHEGVGEKWTREGATERVWGGRDMMGEARYGAIELSHENGM